MSFLNISKNFHAEFSQGKGCRQKHWLVKLLIACHHAGKRSKLNCTDSQGLKWTLFLSRSSLCPQRVRFKWLCRLGCCPQDTIILNVKLTELDEETWCHSVMCTGTQKPCKPTYFSHARVCLRMIRIPMVKLIDNAHPTCSNEVKWMGKTIPRKRSSTLGILVDGEEDDVKWEHRHTQIHRHMKDCWQESSCNLSRLRAAPFHNWFKHTEAITLIPSIMCNGSSNSPSGLSYIYSLKACS